MDVQTFLLIFIVAVVGVGAGWFIYDANRD
jgi:hypothetical protein